MLQLNLTKQHHTCHYLLTCSLTLTKNRWYGKQYIYILS